MSGQLELFEKTLPHKPYATNDLSQGLTICKKQSALKKRYLQHNPPAQVCWLVFDCDRPGALETAHQMGHVPAPNFEVVNPKNGHSHLFYGLAVPVTRTNAARAKPLRYLAAVEWALNETLGGDLAYGGLISKNPLHPHWQVFEHQKTLWELGQLSEFLNLPVTLPKKAFDAGLGRNCRLFETARRWAYKSVLGFKLTATQEAFSAAVLGACEKLNTFPEPLPASEVKATAKSIAKWTWKHYTGRLPDAEFAAVQSTRAKKGAGVSRYRHTATERAAIVAAAQVPGVNKTELAKAHKIGLATLKRWLKTDETKE